MGVVTRTGFLIVKALRQECRLPTIGPSTNRFMVIPEIIIFRQPESQSGLVDPTGRRLVTVPKRPREEGRGRDPRTTRWLSNALCAKRSAAFSGVRSRHFGSLRRNSLADPDRRRLMITRRFLRGSMLLSSESPPILNAFSRRWLQ